MSIPKLIVHRFKTEKENDYLFDNVTGMVFPCTEAMYHVVTNFHKAKEDELIDSLQRDFNLDNENSCAMYAYVRALIENGHFYKKQHRFELSSLTTDDLLKTSLSQLILIVTEDCNIRCKYCIYSDNYPHVKGYSEKHMSFDVARKAIDYYMELHQMRVNNGFKRNPVITFYGGEPLLEFELVKKVVNYCNEKNYQAVIFITTNATLLTDEIINFIIDNNIVLTVSLDGSKMNHDRNRVFPSGGGTFDLIMENVIKLQNEKKRRNKTQAITFSCCFDSFTDLCDTVDFFDKNHDLFYPYSILYNEISKYNTTFYDYCDRAHDEGLISADRNSLNRSVQTLKEKFLNSAIHNEKTSSVGLTYIFFGLMNIIWRSKGLMDNPNSNACIPGSKIAVAPDGKFYVCERVSQMCAIGDVENKLDLKRINDLHGTFLSILDDNCKDCTVSRLCSMCYMHLAKDNKLAFNHEMCEDNKNKIPKALETVFSVLEINPDAFDILLPKESNKTFFEITR